LVFTSSPFFQLRSYLPPDHPDKAKEIGAESTPGQFIDALLDVVELLEPTLAAHGSMMWELGDTMSGSGGGGGDYLPGGRRQGQPRYFGSAAATRNANPAHDGQPVPEVHPARPLSPRPKYAGRDLRFHAPDRAGDQRAGIVPVRTHSRRQIPGWPLDKSLCMVPELFRVALAYGFNPSRAARHHAGGSATWCVGPATTPPSAVSDGATWSGAPATPGTGPPPRTWW
jgi:hypothetical protein